MNVEPLTNRRSPRVLARVPVSLTTGHGPPVYAITAVINRHGALLLSARAYPMGTTLGIRHELAIDTIPCRVVWIGDVDPSGAHKMGIEFIDEAPTFWGRVYDNELDTSHDTGTPSQ